MLHNTSDDTDNINFQGNSSSSSILLTMDTTDTVGGYQGLSIDDLGGLSRFENNTNNDADAKTPIIAHFDKRLGVCESIASVNAISGGGGEKDCGAGGGYATRGNNGSRDNSQGGGVYGNDKMDYLHLGSGGGGDTDDDGTAGGGIIYIECDEKIIIEGGASITAYLLFRKIVPQAFESTFVELNSHYH